MVAGTTVRLPDSLKLEASAYADRLGISLNALIAVALRDYLDVRRGQIEPPPMDSPPLDVYAGELGVETEMSMPDLFPKVGRNSPCPCGSGKKYKACHGR